MMDAGGIRLFVGDGAWYVETTITEAFENSKDASNRLNELIGVFGLCQDEEVPEPEPEPETRAQPWKRWSEEECAVIAGATSPTDAYQKYRAVFPDSTRTEYSVIKKYGKLRRTEPVVVKAADIKIPVSAGDEVTLHEPVEPVREATLPKRKNSWLPEEDNIVRYAPSSADAARLHAAAFPGKRTPAAIDTRWRTFNPTIVRALKEAASSKPGLPERGASVRITGALGLCTGKTGTVIRRDTVIGEVLVNLGSQDGCVWVKPEDFEVVE